MKGRRVRALCTRAGGAALLGGSRSVRRSSPFPAARRARTEQTPRHITYWEKWTGFEGEAMDAVIDDFNAQEVAHAKADPNYAPIEVEKVTISKIEQKLLIAIAGGNPPDLAGHYSFAVAAYADHGALTDLGPLLAQVGLRPQSVHRALHAARRVPRQDLGAAARASVDRARVQQALVQRGRARSRSGRPPRSKSSTPTPSSSRSGK